MTAMMTSDEPSSRQRLEAFGRRVRALRGDAGLGLVEFAAKAHIDRGFLAAVERGERNIGLVKTFAIADALGVDIAELFPRPEPQRHPERRTARPRTTESAN